MAVVMIASNKRDISQTASFSMKKRQFHPTMYIIRFARRIAFSNFILKVARTSDSPSAPFEPSMSSMLAYVGALGESDVL